jgi:hypothetical protein
MHNGMRTARRRVVRIRFAATTAITLSLFLFTFSHADMFWQEDFEAPANLGNWQRSTPSMPYVSSTLPYQGLQSLQLDYNGPTGGGYMDRQHPNVDEVYTRFYTQTKAFSYEASTGTKRFQQMNLNTPYQYPNFWWENIFGSREMAIIGQVVAEPCASTGHAAYDSCPYYPNMARVPLSDNRWYCIETHLKMNKPGVADGVIELWIDGVQTMSHTGRTFRGPSVSNPNGNSSLTNFNNIRIYRQAGVGTMWYDNFAVGSTRIGCSGGSTPSTPTPSTTSAPTTPSGVTFR